MKFVVFFLFLNFSPMLFGQNLSWKFLHPIKNQWIELGEKGTVQEKLIETGELPDPFYGENEKLFAWIEKYDWEFASEFEIDSQLEKEYVDIEFPSIDTYAKIYLNDSLIAKTENAFYLHRFEVKKYLKLGVNKLKVVFTSPVNYHKTAFNKLKTKFPAPNDVGEIAIASMSRKPQYQFGWDWALRMNTIGFWKPVSIVAFDNNRIISAKVETIKIEGKSAELKLDLIFRFKKNEDVVITSQLFGKFHVNLVEGRWSTKHTFNNVKLWWPVGHGEAKLNEDKIQVFNSKKDLLEKREISYGIRTTELIQEKDKWGTSFYFKINGTKIFAKGANYIPQDVFPSRITAESTVNLIQQAYDANFNMIRVWGGGFYQDEVFYETCDKLGIMVWQDLMFACAMYPGDQTFLNTVEKELNYQIPRISAHPSVVYFNGNNEVDVAWKNWGFQTQYMIGPATQKQMEEDYRKLFKDLAPKTISKYTNIPYVHTSPLSNWGKDEYFDHGTMHYWGVWHGKDPIEDFGLKSGRFNAEYGFQSFPEYSTLKTFSEEKDWELNSSVMKHHQKSYVGNGMIKKHSDILFGETKDFKEFIYFSQLTQAKAVGIAISGHRTDAPRTMGTLFWQMNDCWPAPTWSSIDYFNNWKALQYEAKKDYENVAILAQTKKIGEERYYFVSDVDTSFKSEISYKIYNLEGKELFESFFTVNASPYWIQEIARECLVGDFKKNNYIIVFSWTNNLGKSQTRSFYHEVKKLMKTAKEDVSFELTKIDQKEKTALITIENKAFLADCWIFSSKLGVSFDKNFENLLPGKHEIEIKFQETPQKSDFDLIWR